MSTQLTPYERAMDADTDTFVVQIGAWTKTYVARVTTAPREYDRGETITLMQCRMNAPGYRDAPECRVVLIPDYALSHHVDRYGSGLYPAWCLIDLGLTMDDVNTMATERWLMLPPQ